MAAQKVNSAEQTNKLINEVQQGIFHPLYLLMGDEPYYPELLCKAIIENCIDDGFKDFNETICFGPEVNASDIATAAREYPMMAERRLIVIKEAQLMKDLENLSVYCENPLDSTVLVLLLHKASADKRKALYKAVQKNGAVLESTSVRDYEIAGWIQNYCSSKGLQIEPEAAALFGESTGTELSTIVVETDKLLKNIPEDRKTITVADVEKNVGISRQFSVFELTKELSYRNAPKALQIARNIGESAKFAMPMAVSALYTHFARILRYDALLQKGRPGPEQKASALKGVNPYFYREYDTAAANYPLRSAMNVVALLCEYDYKGKGGDGESASPCDLLVELICKILNS